MKSEIPFSGIGGKKRGKSTASSPLLRQGKNESFLALPREESPTTYDSTRFNYSSFSGMEVQLLNCTICSTEDKGSKPRLYSYLLKNRKNVEIRDSKHGFSIGPSTLNAPIRTPEAVSSFSDFFYR